jgi:hypothetical protein
VIVKRIEEQEQKSAGDTPRRAMHVWSTGQPN